MRFCVLCALAVALAAMPPVVKAEGVGSIWDADRETLTGEFWGVGSTLSEKGLTVGLSALAVVQGPVAGGAVPRRGSVIAEYELEMTLELERVTGGAYRGGWVYMMVEGSAGRDSNEFVGALFPPDKHGTVDRGVFIKELFYQHNFLEDKVLVRAGKLDMAGSFAGPASAGSFDGNAFANDEDTQFLNAALVNNPTIPFPAEGMGAIVQWSPTEWLYMLAGVADSDANVLKTGLSSGFHGPANFLVVGEIGFLPSFGGLDGGYRVGMWTAPYGRERLDGAGERRGDTGVYLSLDQMLYREGDTDQGLGVFARYGLADEAVNAIEHFWSVGAQYQGLIPGRDGDVVAIGFAQGCVSDQAGFSAGREIVVEAYYRAAITRWMSITPDVQWIVTPGADRSVDNAVVVGLRA